MPRPRPPHLHREATRHGRLVWYVRRDKGPRIRIRAEYGTPEFEVEYQAALAGTPPPRKQGPNAGSLAWLIARHRETTEWAVLSVATRRQRENIFEQVGQSAGDQPFTKITTILISTGTPASSAARRMRINLHFVGNFQGPLDIRPPRSPYPQIRGYLPPL